MSKVVHLFFLVSCSTACAMGCAAGDGAEGPDDSSQIAESEDVDAIDAPGLETKTILAGCSAVVRIRQAGDTCNYIYHAYFSGQKTLYNYYNPTRPCDSLATGAAYCSPR